VAVGIGLVAAALTWVSSICIDCDAESLQAPVNLSTWFSFYLVGLLGATIIYGGWRLVQASERSVLPGGLPRWLISLLIGAALLRLALGVAWYLALPQYGHGTPQEQDGYVMADAHKRDQLAQKIALSQRPVSQILKTSQQSDAYGGMLFISAMIYRYLSADHPSPLSMVVVTAAVSSLAVIITWSFGRRSWNERVARLAAWGLALYPEAVLLGSSQMREAFVIPFVAGAFYGLARLRREHSWIGVAWIAACLLLTLLISPPFTIMLVIILGLTAIAVRADLVYRRLKMPSWGWLLLAGIVLLSLLGGWLYLSSFAPPEITRPVDIASYWLRKSIDLQAYFSKGASGWLQKIFNATPEWTHLLILTGYGILRPFLPAALVVSSDAPIWPWITLWRATGWALLIGLLAYATLRAWIKGNSDAFTRALTIITWLVIIVASLRGGGDQDDNPRYRAAFISIQVGLAAWGWVEQKRSSDPWFRRAMVTTAFVIAWSLLWYLRRYYAIPWAAADPFKVIGLGLACGALYSLWDWSRGLSKPVQ
jgi:hypothetical protein